MWGQVVFLLSYRCADRIIPTRVGTSEYLEPPIVQCRDHPHACGDKFFQFADATAGAGSSPRVWGQDFCSRCNCQLQRIIPTRVGTSGWMKMMFSVIQDHPHACGDKRQVLYPLRRVQGSSPRVWGQVHPASFLLYHRWIIPTRVGTR
mgnify:CR=1 FL=1